MRTIARNTIFITLLFWALIGAQAQSPPHQTPIATGSITGRVTINDQPALGVKVAAQLSSNLQRDSLAEAVTDEAGRYQLTGLAAGRYLVLALAPGFAAAADTNDPRSPGPTVNVTDGQTVTGIDFALVRGAIITGRVTDADGQPVIRERITLLRLDARGQKLPYNNQTISSAMFNTDDRGIYRIYGLPAGSYLVSIGRNSENIYSLYSGVFYPRTFYPGVTDEAQAKTIDLKPGDEAAKIDITLGRLVQSYSVFGHIVDSETGQLIPNGHCGFGPVKGDEQFRGHLNASSSVDTRGEFRQSGLLPGRYLFMLLPLETAYYSEPVTVEITDRDITNLEIKARRGGSISGVVTIEGRDDPAALALLSQFRVGVAHLPPESSNATRYFPIKADGSFTVTGVPPGQTLMWIPLSPEARDQLLRIERNGVAQTKPYNVINVAPGEQITGLRLVALDNYGSVRGKVAITGGTLPDGARLRVFVHRVGRAYGSPAEQVIEVGVDGNFALENLQTDRYEFTLRAWLTSNNQVTLLPSAPSQTVTVTKGTTTQVTLTLDLSAKEEKR